MSFTTELQDLKTKIEALIAAGGIIEPALISQLAEINQALDTGGGGGGTSQATIEAAINAATDTEIANIYQRLDAIRWAADCSGITSKVVKTGFVRPADTTPYTAGDAIHTASSGALNLVRGGQYDDPPIETTGTILAIQLISTGTVSGDVAIMFGDSDGDNSAADNAPANVFGLGHVITFPSANWTNIGANYYNRVECVFPFRPISPTLNLRGQLIALEAMTLASAQGFSIQVHLIWNYGHRKALSYFDTAVDWTNDGWI